MTRTHLLLWIGYAAVLFASVAGMFVARRKVFATLDTPEARAEWTAWKEETARLSKTDEPMKRREAKSAEPPALVFFRDYFGTAIATSVVGVTLFYWFTAWLIRGSMRTPAVSGVADVGGTSMTKPSHQSDVKLADPASTPTEVLPTAAARPRHRRRRAVRSRCKSRPAPSRRCRSPGEVGRSSIRSASSSCSRSASAPRSGRRIASPVR